MITLQFLAGWTLRSSILILAGALLLWALRVKNPAIRVAAWTAMLVGSLAIPALTAALPKMPLAINWPAMPSAAAPRVDTPVGIYDAADVPMPIRPQSSDITAQNVPVPRQEARGAQPFDWPRAALILYLVVAGALLLRLSLGLLLSLRLLQRSSPTGRLTDKIEIRESDRVDAPVTLGVMRPAIVLPADWREWAETKLEAVLAHERSHVRRRDPMVQVLSMIHRAVLWHNPLSWFLHQHIVRSAEEASDDAALAATRDRATYAAVLLDFMQRAVSETRLVGVRMARYDSPVQRIHRILDGTVISSGLTRWSVAAILALGSPLAYVVATAQVRPEFEIADVHASLSKSQMDGGVLLGGRYEIQTATLLDLIATAYGVARDTVVGGPSGLDWNRFDVIARVPANTRPDAVPLMLQSLLADRFKVVVRNGTRPLPVYVLSLGTDKHKLNAAKASDQPACKVAYDNDGLSCRNTTMDAFAARLAAGMSTKFRVLNSTGIEGSWDFDISYPRPGPRRGMWGIPSPNDSDRGIFDAIEKQLGLKLELRDVPQPVLVVDSANETPSANPPDLATRLTPAPVEFEVASIKPCKGFDPFEERPSSGFLVNTGCMSLQMHIVTAWDFYTPIQFGGMWVRAYGGERRMDGPKNMASQYFEIAARSPVAIVGQHDPNYLAMLRNLLLKRFQMATHYEDRPMDVDALVAAKPKLKKADPSRRTGCDPGLMGTRGSRTVTVLTCQNVTMEQFAEQLGGTVAGLMGRVVDATGIAGNWDLSVSYMIAALPGALGPGADASEPLGGVTLREALEQQLGLKVEKQKRPMPVFVIDHIEDQPTEN